MPMKNGSYVFKTDLKLEDYIGLSMQIVRVPMCLLVLAVDAFLCYTLFERLGRSWALTGALFVGLFVMLFLLERFYIRWRAKRIFNASEVSREIILTLDEEGITQQARGGETRLAWGDVLRVTNNKTCSFVFLNSKQAFYFPKRNFEDQADERQFWDLIMKHVALHKIKVR